MIEKLKSGKAKLVYYFIDVNGTVTLDDIRNELYLKEITVFPILRNLAERGFIEKVDYRYKINN